MHKHTILYSTTFVIAIPIQKFAFLNCENY